MRIKTRPSKVLQKVTEPLLKIKEEPIHVDPLQVYNLRRNLRKSHGERDAKIKRDDFNYATWKRDPEDHPNDVFHGIEDAKKKFKCNQCEYSTNAPINLREHNNAHRGIKPNKCEHCEFSTSYKSNLNQHRKTHMGIDALKPGFVTSNSSRLYRNRKTQNQHRAAKIKCDHCDYATYYRGNLKDHVTNVHLCIKDLKCTVCNYETSYRSSLRNHMKRMHEGYQTALSLGETIPGKSLGAHKTSSGGKMLVQVLATSKVEYNWNTDMIEFSRKLSCDQCDFVATTKRGIIEHRNSHLGIKDKKCDKCAFSTSYSHSLRRHIKDIHGQYLKELTKYGIIGKYAIKSEGIETKKQVHNDEVLHSCPYSPNCQFKKSRPEIILRHIALVHVRDRAITQVDDQTDNPKDKYAKKREEGKSLSGNKENKCNHCNFTTAYRSNLKQHISCVHGFKSFKCTLCNFATSYRKSFNNHLVVIHSASKWERKEDHMELDNRIKTHKCTCCQFTSSNRKNLDQHLVVIHGVKNNTCKFCDFATCYKNNLHSHMKKVHAKERNTEVQQESPDRQRGQSICEEVDKNEGKKYTDCLMCGFSADNQSDFNAHLMTNHVAIQKETLSNHNATDLQLEKNMPVVLLERLSKKQVEQMSFSNSCNGGGQSVFNCDQCEFSTTNALKLRGHKNAHGKIKVNKCEYCDFATSKKSNLAQHRKVHQRDNLFSCPYNPECDYKNFRFPRMQRHMLKTHIDESTSAKDPNITNGHTDFSAKSKSNPINTLAKYKCDECNYSTTYSSRMNEHKNAHVGIKNNKCEYCDFATCYRNNLYSHKKKVHSKERNTEVQKEQDKNEGKRYTDCLMCGFSADNQGDLNAHLLTNHVAI